MVTLAHLHWPEVEHGKSLFRHEWILLLQQRVKFKIFQKAKGEKTYVPSTTAYCLTDGE